MLRTYRGSADMTRANFRTVLGRVPIILAALFASAAAHASMFQGETLDAVANGISWVVLILVPVVVLVVFWLVHILPEKIAEQRKHPQAKAIQVLCLLSLVFGGMLWPLAWLWAYSKPVLYKMAYGTDVAEEHHGESADAPAATAVPEAARGEIEQLRVQLASLEARLGPEARG
jgi:CBS domain containing-hemolysin-like protein